MISRATPAAGRTRTRLPWQNRVRKTRRFQEALLELTTRPRVLPMQNFRVHIPAFGDLPDRQLVLKSQPKTGRNGAVRRGLQSLPGTVFPRPLLPPDVPRYGRRPSKDALLNLGRRPNQLVRVGPAASNAGHCRVWNLKATFWTIPYRNCRKLPSGVDSVKHTALAKALHKDLLAAVVQLVGVWRSPATAQRDTRTRPVRTSVQTPLV